MRRKISVVQAYLTLASVVILIVSNLISAQLLVTPFENSKFFSTMTAAVVIFPLTSILSDVFSEVYGYKWSRRGCYLGFAFNLGVNLILTLIASLNIVGDTADAFKVVFGITTGMGWCVLAASFIAYMVGDFVNDLVFEKMRLKKENHKGFGFRAILSTVFGQLCDSFIYLPLALVILPRLFLGFSFVNVPTVLGMCLMQLIIKVLYEIVLLPVTTRVTFKVIQLEEKFNDD